MIWTCKQHIKLSKLKRSCDFDLHAAYKTKIYEVSVTNINTVIFWNYTMTIVEHYGIFGDK